MLTTVSNIYPFVIERKTSKRYFSTDNSTIINVQVMFARTKSVRLKMKPVQLG